MKIKLSDKQMEAWKALNNKEVEVILYGGQSMSGKSYLASFYLLTSCLIHSGIRMGFCRKNLKTLKTTSLKTFYKVCSDFNIKKNIHFKMNEISNIITFKNGIDKEGNPTGFENGSEIHLINLEWKPSDPDGDFLGGLELSGCVIDELPEIPQAYFEVIYSRIRYRLDDFKITKKLFATCNPSNGWVKPYFYDRFKNNTLPKEISFISTSGSNNFFRDKDYEKKLSLLSEQKFKRLELGDWEYANSIDQLFDNHKLERIFSDLTQLNKTNQHYISADIARFGEDNSVIIVWNDFRIIEIIKLSKKSLVETANKIKELMNKFQVPRNQVVADEDGLGGGIVDMLKCKGFRNGSKPLKDEKFDMLKSQMYFKAVKEDWSVADFISSEYKEQIRKELTAIRDNSDEFKYKINTKDEQKKLLANKSPDFGDAIAMRFFFCYQHSKLIFDTVR